MGLFKKKNNRIEPPKPKHSINSSTGSMTKSELNMAIMEMLNLNQTSESCDYVCRGNPITEGGKRRQLLKMLSVALLPMAVLVGMTGNVFVSTIQNFMEAKETRDVLFFSIELGQMMRYLQRERDMSALYISAIGPDTKEFLLKRYPDTDMALENLSYWPVSKKNDRQEFQSKDKFLLFLNRHRYQLDLYNRTSKEEILFYTDVIDIFITWLYDAVSEARSGSIWKTLVAYQEIIVASEYIGRERGMGVTYFAFGGFRSKEDYLLFLEAQDIANITFMSCRRYSELAYSIYENQLLNNDLVLAPVRSMRLQIRSNKSFRVVGSLTKANEWFDNMTLYQDIVRDTQKALAGKIDDMLTLRSTEDMYTIITIACIFGAVFIVCPLVITGVYYLTSEIQKYSISIANRTKALNKEKKRTDTLLYQMLPKSVAERLKCNEQVDAEHYDQATIFFSDIVGFTKISSSSSPLQIVDMLNSLYTCFDERIEMYDVYKVETIGDAYMVVSGVPRKNGIRHASEIAKMAFDLLRKIRHLEIPHLPGIKFSLRIGCHSGSVVAGVVGNKMPRYCLFGETVSVASKMESLGKANKIHLSESTHDLLKSIGGFTMPERKDDVLQNDQDLLNAFKGIIHTYWLTEVEGVDNDSDSIHTENDDLHGTHAAGQSSSKEHFQTACSTGIPRQHSSSVPKASGCIKGDMKFEKL
ncbi:uncharacterized protein LOC134253775 [Saccostrea cucullata]|uniref:uncharacterized protein LOC134253775 n=1 Tax=Saccostrea cuccullata TaxID=36930 RepID=UPI002ED4C066